MRRQPLGESDDDMSREAEQGTGNPTEMSTFPLGLSLSEMNVYSTTCPLPSWKKLKCILNQDTQQVNGSTVGPLWELNETILRKCLVQSLTQASLSKIPSSIKSASSPNDAVYEGGKKAISALSSLTINSLLSKYRNAWTPTWPQSTINAAAHYNTVISLIMPVKK